jgi:hypothetical protein
MRNPGRNTSLLNSQSNASSFAHARSATRRRASNSGECALVLVRRTGALSQPPLAVRGCVDWVRLIDTDQKTVVRWGSFALAQSASEPHGRQRMAAGPGLRAALDAQREHWERALTERADRFGIEASAAGRAAADRFAREGARDLLELGAAGQGRDTLFFAEQGFDVHALDYTESGLTAIDAKAAAARLGGHIHTTRGDARKPLPFADACFDACYSHMLYCMALTQRELCALTAEVRRVMRPGGLNVTPHGPPRTPTTAKASTAARASTSWVWLRGPFLRPRVR